MLKHLVALLVTLVALALAHPQARAADAAPQLVAGRYVIDVRSREEFEQGHIDGALWIPHDQIGARIEAVLPDRTAPIGLYCGSGGRAGKALATLEAMGYTQAENLGGIEDARQKLKPQPAR